MPGAQAKRLLNCRLWIAVGLVLVAVATLWHAGIAGAWTPRVTAGWRWQSHFIGISTSPDSLTGKFPDKDSVGSYDRQIQPLVDARARAGLTLQDSYVIRDAANNQITYQYIYQARVDPQSGRNLDTLAPDEYFVFPRDTQKQTYKLRFSYLKGIPVTFQRQEQIEGLNTYLFAYKGRGEYTESYLGTAEYPGTVVRPGQEIKCRDDQFSFRVWVEPTTGETIKVDESCYSGDYLYDIASGTVVAPVLRWGGVTAGDDLIRRTDAVRGLRTTYLAATLYLPLALLLAGLAALGLGLFPIKRQGA